MIHVARGRIRSRLSLEASGPAGGGFALVLLHSGVYGTGRWNWSLVAGTGRWNWSLELVAGTSRWNWSLVAGTGRWSLVAGTGRM